MSNPAPFNTQGTLKLELSLDKLFPKPLANTLIDIYFPLRPDYRLAYFPSRKVSLCGWKTRLSNKELDGPLLPFSSTRLKGGRKVRAPQGKTLGNTQKERSLESATENKPPCTYFSFCRNLNRCHPEILNFRICK